MARDFEQSVARQVVRLNAGDQTMEAESASKRVSWFRKHYPDHSREGVRSPREAYELFLLEYLGLREQEVPVVSESDSEIVWLSCNRCPTLEACQRLSLDPRNVCRRMTEKPAQALLSQLDPQLRFERSYDEIRPHARHCKERIYRLSFDGTMRLAIEEARVSRSEGNKGYGAVVVLGNEIIGKAHDTAVTGGDPSLHAEVNAIRQAAQKRGEPDLCGGVLFATCEPCPMCASLAVWANLTTIVYGASIEETAQLGKSRILVGCQEIVDRSPALLEVVGGVLNEECRALYI